MLCQDNEPCDEVDYTEADFDKMDKDSLFELWMDAFATLLLCSTNETYEQLCQQSERYREALDKRFPENKEACDQRARELQRTSGDVGSIY